MGFCVIGASRQAFLLASCAVLAVITSTSSAAAAGLEDSLPGETIADGAPALKGALAEEIVVTAQRRSQNLQDVGIAITALSGEQISALGLNSSTDIAKIAPNVALSGSYGGLMSNFVIRGVTQNDFNDHVESVVATYIDDTYIASQQGSNFTMFDIDRLEALKGPQGTLFGRNATGGTIQFISRRPTSTFEAYADATYSSYNNVRLEGAISGPLTEGLRARLSGFFERADGYLKNDYPQAYHVTGGRAQGAQLGDGAGADLGGIKSNFALRGQIQADLSDSVQLWASGSYSKLIAGSAPYQLSDSTLSIQDANGVQINTVFAPTATCEVLRAGACAPGFFESSPTRPAPGTDFYGYVDPDGRGLHTSVDYAYGDGSRADAYSGSAKLTAELGFANLTWISDYKRFSKDFQFDLVPDPTNAYIWIAQSHSNQISQELRLDGKSGPLQWVFGGYFLRINNRSTNGLGALPGSIFDPFFVGDEPRIAHLVSKSYSLFGQLEYQLTDQLTVIAGLRGSREAKDYDLDVLFTPTAAGDNPRDFAYAGGISELSYNAHSTDTLWNWKAQLNYKPVPGLLLYAGITQGQKAGSFNSAGPTDFTSVAQIPYKPERLVSYEAGFKASLLNRRLRFNGAVYYYDYNNYQAAQWVGLSSIIINAKARFHGAEVELIGSPTPDIDISLNGAWQKNTVYDVPVGGRLRDVETTFAPEWTFSGLARYTYPEEIAGGKVAVQGAATYQSRVWHNLNNFDANYLHGYFLTDARISWTASDGHLTLAVFAKNLFDKRYETVGFDEAYVTGGNITSPGRPRWIGANVRMNF